MFNEYPYTDYHELNTDWIIGKIKNVETAEKNTKEYMDTAVEAKDIAVEAKDDAVEAKDDAISFLTGTKDQLDLLQARVDNIIPDGTQTAGNTELLDIRVGANSITYSSAGDAVRGQITDLNSAFRNEQDSNIESTRNLLLPQNWKIMGNISNPYVKYDLDNGDINITSLRNGSYLGVCQTLDVRGIDYITTSCESATGDGESRIRFGECSDMETFVSWIGDYAVGNNIVLDVQAIDYIRIALYVAWYTSQNAGVTMRYNKIQLEARDHATPFVLSNNPNDTVLRDSLKNSDYLCNIIVNPTLFPGYVECLTGKFAGASLSTYKRTDYIKLPEGTHYLFTTLQAGGTAGIAFYDENYEYCGGQKTDTTPFVGSIPSTAKYCILSCYRGDEQFTNLEIHFYVVNSKNKTINCLGDSVTEGMSMPDQTFANYYGSTYPSHLLKLLYDNGYDYFVNNYGVSGESSIEVCARVGGRGSAYFEQNTVFPGAATLLDLTGILYSSFKDENNQQYVVDFQRGGYRSEYVWIENLCYELAISGGVAYLKKIDVELSDVTIPRNKSFIVGDAYYNRNPNITIVYMGINDNDISMTQWIDRINSIKEVNGGHVLVIGSTSHWWTKFTDVRDTAYPYEEYYNRARETFGNTFVDLEYYMNTQRGIDIAIDAGYLSGRTPADIAADNAAIAAGNTPPSLTVDGTAGNVHFNDAGYYVMAKIIFDRLVHLHWLS